MNLYIYIYTHTHTHKVLKRKGLKTSKEYCTRLNEKNSRPTKVQTPMPTLICVIFVLSLQQMLCVTPMLVNTFISFFSLKKCVLIFFKKILVLLVFPNGLSVLVAVNTYKSLMVSEHIKVFT